MSPNLSTPWYVLAALLTVLVAGCIGSPTRPANFYVLSAEEAPPVAGRTSPAPPLSIGVGPIELPDLFDRPQIVTRPDPNRIDLAEFDRWGGDLNKDLSRVLAQNLMDRLNTDTVLLHPWSSRRELDFEITIRFFRFDGVLDEAAELDGVWRLIDGREGCEHAGGRFRIEEPVPGSGYGGLVTAISRAVARLSDDMAAAVAAADHTC
ncbi:MAG: PqiC family protein [Gammaproteobacteria bacterium]